MFSNALLASALMATSAVAQSVGSAIVVNMCTYPVYVANTPAADGGYSAITEWLDSNGGSYTQQWTQLTNGDGWSIKLSTSTDLSNIMQYEYTYHDDEDIIWYDLSDVNGNPWNENWEITATSASGECDPKDQAYRYSTDDAYGMQACPSDAVITVTLCSGNSTDDSGAASASSVAAAQTSTAQAQTSTFTTPTSTPSVYASTTQSVASSISSAGPSSTESAVVTTSVSSTTLVTSTTATRHGTTITDVETAVVTDIVTATWWNHPGKRHEHHHRRHGVAGRL